MSRRISPLSLLGAARTALSRRARRAPLSLALLLVVAACGDSRAGGAGEEGVAASPEGRAAEGWLVWAEEETVPGVFDARGGIEVRAEGEAVVFRRDDVRVEPFEVSAVIRIEGDPELRSRGVGLFVGGRDLLVEGRRYLSFLVRTDGEFAVVRNGPEGREVLVDWTANAAVRTPPSAAQDAVNRLRVSVGETEVLFHVNDEELYRAPVATVEPFGGTGVVAAETVRFFVGDLTVR